ncbi:MAG: Holliday junction resolvase RuvX [Oscillospiraceae bacterium]|nr:Holliday junction resolvase RuvX [Oscillospiraceae bacterium]
MRIMAVDYGDARTGLAVSDLTATIASPAKTIREKDFALCVKQVAAAAIEYKVEEIIVGNPINMNGTKGPRSQKCEMFADKLREEIKRSETEGTPVIMWDERSTTVSANNIMNELNRRGKKRKECVDALAAAVLLESYLNYRKGHV